MLKSQLRLFILLIFLLGNFSISFSSIGFERARLFKELLQAFVAEKEGQSISALVAYNDLVNKMRAEIHHGNLKEAQISQAHYVIGMSYFGVARSLLQKDNLDSEDQQFIYMELLNARQYLSRSIYQSSSDPSLAFSQSTLPAGGPTAKHLSLALVYIYLGQTTEAIGEMQKVINSSFNHPFAEELLRRMQSDFGVQIQKLAEEARKESSTRNNYAILSATKLGNYMVKNHLDLMDALIPQTTK